jgi:hypothetical protein
MVIRIECRKVFLNGVIRPMLKVTRCLMDATQKTIAFLRTLTLDGLLTSDEVWAIGKFFNDNPECTQEWPGDVLAPMIGSAFDDSEISEEEMTLLAETISNIEAEWLSRNPGLADSEDYAGPFTTQSALTPVIDARIEVPSLREDQSYVVSLHPAACTCPEWNYSRKSLAERHPGRCCKHVAYAYARTGKVFEPWFQAVLDDCFAYARGTSPKGEWLLVQIPDQKPAVVCGAPDSWCTVFAPRGQAYQSFAFNPEQRRWSYGEAPARSGVIAKAIREHFTTAHA